ncbi:MAG: hypothetical protein AAFY26_02155 [Cyanobacteria bacterium J06638_22]
MTEQELINALNGQTLQEAIALNSRIFTELSALVRPPKGQPFSGENRRLLQMFWLKIPSNKLQELEALIDSQPIHEIALKADINGDIFTPTKSLTNARQGEPFEPYAPFLSANGVFTLTETIEFPSEDPPQ